MAMPKKKEFKRLPTDVKPENYTLRLQPDLDKFTFKGQETIDVKVLSSTTSITLNSEEIEIQSAHYKAADAGDQNLKAEVKFEPENASVILSFPSALQPGSGQLCIDFTGELNDKMKGFYRSKYFSPSGEEKYGAVTQFQATDARRAFPCWDEPAVKATFDVTLVVPKNRVALSNMPVKSENDLPEDSTWKVVTYERTPIMSTYLLAFVVGEYDYVEDKDSDGVLVRVYTPVGKKEQGQFALEVAVKTLLFYNNYFQIAYPLPKIDLIAIANCAAGAMENWGLVTYREIALLIEDKNSSSKSNQWVALMVGHELAHQWFGNLVTMEWWTHLWLNEGFASWIEYLCVDHCFPEFDIWTQFMKSNLGKALEMDALQNSHAVEIPVGHPDEVNEIFDAISYCKGASVIRMLHDYVGDESFKKGMNQYLTKFKYKNAVTEDLWESLGKASGKPVLDVMTTWTKQMGYPMVKVIEKQEGSNRVLTLTQEKFCADGVQEKEGSFFWIVPVSISTASDPKKAAVVTLLDKTSMDVTVPNVSPDQWVKVNCESVGVYRVQYSSETLDRFIPAIKNKTLPPRDRLGLQNDFLALASAGMISTEDVLKVGGVFDNEDDYPVWINLTGNLGQGHKQTILDPKGSLCSKIINFSLEILKKQFNGIINGMELTNRAPVYEEHTKSWKCDEKFQHTQPPSVQIHHTGRNHWVTSFINYNKKIFILDSLSRSKNHTVLTESLEIQLVLIYGRDKRPIPITILDVQQQENSNDCGLFAIANLIEFCFDPDKSFQIQTSFVSEYMRSHLVKCLENGEFTKFPQTSQTSNTSESVKK